MGTKPSSIAGSPMPDDRSVSSVIHRPLHKDSKSSTNLFKRADSKSPLPRPLTATTLVATERDDSPGVNTSHASHSLVNLRNDSLLHERTPPLIIDPIRPTDSEKPDDRPQSTAETVKDCKTATSSDWSDVAHDEYDGGEDSPPVFRSSALSPTIPAPSPLPEDSPHKYGLKSLKDCMDTTGFLVPPQREDAEANKPYRRSSGLEIFRGARTLQSASSFLNNLSTSRRRAESHARMTEASLRSHPPRPTSRSSARPTSRGTTPRPSSAAYLRNTTPADNQSRHLGHNFKATGFTYARNLDITQLKCYIGHSRLHPSRNKLAPVECSVCHMDDDAEHWSCAWCAIRLCRYCWKEFDNGGLSALRERIRMAELGDVNGDEADKEGGRGRRKCS